MAGSALLASLRIALRRTIRKPPQTKPPINSIVVKAKSFTAATVPASRATDGNNFFTSFFNQFGKEVFLDLVEGFGACVLIVVS